MLTFIVQLISAFLENNPKIFLYINKVQSLSLFIFILQQKRKYGKLQNQKRIVRPEIGNREKHYGKHGKCPKKQAKQYVKRGETSEGMAENMQGIVVYKDFLGIQSLIFKPLHTQTENPLNFRESLLFFPYIYLCKKVRNLSTQQLC